MELMIEASTSRAREAETRRRNARNYRMQMLFEECILKLDYKTYCLGGNLGGRGFLNWC